MPLQKSIEDFANLDNLGQLNVDIIGDDGTIIINTIDNSINASSLVVNNLNIEPLGPFDTQRQILTISSNESVSAIELKRIEDTNSQVYGSISFTREDKLGTVATSRIFGGGDQGAIYFIADSDHIQSPNIGEQITLTWVEGKLGIGKFYPTESLDVNGNAIINGTITAGGFIQFGSYTDTEITNITPTNGMVYYDATDNRFRGYQNGKWINLDDGSPALGVGGIGEQV